MRHWSECYAQLAERVRVVAPEARPVLLSTTVDVDYIYRDLAEARGVT